MNKVHKIKNKIEDIILSIKNKFTSSKYVVKGKCKKCGKCCSNVLFSTFKGYIKDESEYEELKKKYPSYRAFYPNGRVENEKGDANGAILFKCRFLNEKGRCSVYFFRPPFCRSYPKVNKEFIQMGGTMLDDCGFYFEPDKKFIEYL